MKKKLLIFIFLLLVPAIHKAQCSMCRAVAESSSEAGSEAASGLNEGIIYLMAFPYLLMAGVGFAIYRLKKSKTDN